MQQSEECEREAEAGIDERDRLTTKERERQGEIGIDEKIIGRMVRSLT